MYLSGESSVKDAYFVANQHHINQRIFLVLAALILLLIAIGGSVYYANMPIRTVSNSQSPRNDDLQIPDKPSILQSPPSWEFDRLKWAHSSQPPGCDSPLRFAPPVDLSKVTSILYPGQVRGGDFKPHGGFIFQKSNPRDIQVKAPLNARLIFGSRYREQGEIQYLLFFIHPCGIAYMFDHLLTLAPKFQKIVSELPEPKDNDSRTTRFSNPIEVEQDEVIATAVGFEKLKNTTVDFGVYDLRQKNQSSQSRQFSSKYAHKNEQAFYAICWLKYFDPVTNTHLASLPGGDSISGVGSDYCQ